MQLSEVANETNFQWVLLSFNMDGVACRKLRAAGTGGAQFNDKGKCLVVFSLIGIKG